MAPVKAIASANSANLYKKNKAITPANSASLNKKNKAATSANNASSNKKNPEFAKNMADLIMEDEADFETLVKEEHIRLSRRWRMIEEERHLLLQNNHSLDGRMLENLANEKMDIQTDIYNLEDPQCKAKDESTNRKIIQMLEDLDRQNNQITVSLRQISEIKEIISKITTQITEEQLRAKALCGRRETLTPKGVERTNRVLENRLYVETTKLDSKNSENKELREDIQVYIRLRGIFHDRLIETKVQLAKIKQRMNETVFLASAAYDLRDDWNNKLKTLRDRDDKDSKQHISEMKEYTRIIENDTKLHSFMRTKDQERVCMENYNERIGRKKAFQLQEICDKLVLYQESFKLIFKHSHEKDSESLLHTYLTVEQESYSTFRYITDLDCEITSLTDQNLIIARDIDKHVKSHKQRFHDYNQEREECEKQIEECQEFIEKFKQDEQLENDKNALFYEQLEELYEELECDKSPAAKLLKQDGDKIRITSKNAVISLKVIEIRVDSLFKQKEQYKLRTAYEAGRPPRFVYLSAGRKGQIKGTGGPFSPVVSLARGYDEEEDESDRKISERPRFLEELRKTILEKNLQDATILQLGQMATEDDDSDDADSVDLFD